MLTSFVKYDIMLLDFAREAYMINIMISGCEKDNRIYSNLLSFDKNLNIESTTSTEKSTLQHYFEKKPDILILDISASNLNSFNILSKISKSGEGTRKNIIAITDDSSYNIFNHSQFLGVISKPVTEQKLLSNIYNYSSSKPNSITTQEIQKLLLKLKIDLYSIGIQYLIDSILIASKNHQLLQNLQDIYEIIGSDYNISPEKIKWSIRNTVNIINKYVDSSTFRSIFKYYDDSRNLTPKYFIKLVLYYFEIDTDI